MSTGRIMTLSVQSLNKLYFTFLQTHVLPLLPKPSPEINSLLQKRSAYEAHRFLQDLLTTPTAEPNNTSLNGSLNNLSNRPQAPVHNNYNYSLSASTEQPKLYNDLQSFEKSLDKKQEEKRGQHRLGLKRTLTSNNYDQRVSEFKISQPEEKNNHISVTQSARADTLMSIPSLGGPSTISDFKTDFQKPQTPGIDSSLTLQKKSKSKVMKECISKISRLFNDNHSKIEKYSKKVQSQNKLFSLNVSTKMQRKEDIGKLMDYQFHVKDMQNRKF